MHETSSCSTATPKKCVLIAGEQSGDNHGARLIEALQHLDPSLIFMGVGGSGMQKQFHKTFAAAEELHIMGFTKVLQELPRLYKLLSRLAAQIRAEKPAVVVTIDLPDFNLFLAKKLRKQGFQGLLVHYISPSVWAWRKGRVKTIAKHYNLLLTIFPFEAAYYKNSSLRTVYVGNPTLETFLQQEVRREKEPLIAIFPGSRLAVIEANLPLQLAAARQTGLKIAVSLAHKKALPLLPDDVEVVPEKERFQLMQRAEKAIATSGTIALEIALAGVPTVCTYKISPLNYFLAYYIFRIRRPFYVMPNILLGRKLMPEIIGSDINSSQIAQALHIVSPLLAQEGAEEIKQILDTKDNAPSLQAAKEILNELSRIHS